MKLSFLPFSLSFLLAADFPSASFGQRRSLRHNNGYTDRILQELGNIEEILANEGFDRFVQYIDASGLDYTDPAQSLTMFAPTDAALANLESQIQFDPADPANYFLTRDLLRYLALGPARLAANFTDGEIDEDGTGFDLTFTQNPFALNGAPISRSDIQASNGIIHAVDPLVYPEGYWVFTTVVDYLAADEDYSTLVSLLQQTGLDEVLKTGLYTIFAPSNTAFEELGADKRAFLTAPENEEDLKQVLLYHVVPRLACSCDITDNDGELTLETVQGEDVQVVLSFFSGMVEDVSINVFNFDEVAGNGIIHGLRGVLIPSTVVLPLDNLEEVLANEGFDRFVQYIDASGLDYTDPDDSLTMFAPTDAALANLESQIQFDPADPTFYFLTGDLIRYLVLSPARLAANFTDGEIDKDGTGFDLTFTQNPFALNGAPISRSDIQASNGIIHALDTLLYPEGYWVFTNIVDYLAADEDFTTLVSLLQQTGLDEVLETGFFTIFAPNNAAFEELGAENIAFLTAPENEEDLKQVLLYHVVPRLACSCDVVANGGELTLETVQGEDVRVEVTISSGIVEDVDIEVSNFDDAVGNGIIHELRGVLLPSTVDIIRPTDSPTDSPIDLDDVGNNGKPEEAFPLGRCQGDCDSDDDCAGDLQCFVLDSSETVPGCVGTRRKTKGGRLTDYCYAPADMVDPPLNEIGNNGIPKENFPLGLCEGDCDSDDDCDGELKCFDSPDDETVPGCSGTRRMNARGNRVDFCYQP